MATISGTVKDASGEFARRVVRAYRRSDGALASQAVSDATTGAFACAALDSSEHYVLLLDGSVSDYDPYWSNVVLAMHMDDVGLTDVKGHTITLVGTAARSAAQSKFGGYSALFNAATPNQWNRLSVTGTLTDFSFSGDFTVEFYMYPTAFGASWGSYVVDTRNTSTANGTGWFIYYGYASSGNKLSVYDGTTSIATTFVPPLNAWSHVAVVRASGVISVYANGALVNTPVSNSATMPCSQFLIGCAGNAASTTGIAGYIDDLRITKGVARYTANFTPPSSAFPGGPVPGTPTANALIFDNITPV